MGTLSKTSTIPPASAETVLGMPILKMVILGNYPDSVIKANDLATDPPTAVDRWVLWFQLPNEGELRTLFPALPTDIDNILGFVLSTTNKIADILYKNEPIDYVRIGLAFTNGGLPEFN
jgi:hypothetical protein